MKAAHLKFLGMVPATRKNRRKLGSLFIALLSVLVLVLNTNKVAAQTKNIQDAINVIVMFCVAGGEKVEFSSVGSDGAGIELKSGSVASGSGITISKSEAIGLVDGIRREMSNVSANQASEARHCMQPYIQRIIDTLLGASTPVSLSFPSRSVWNHNNSIMSITSSDNKIKIYYDKPRQGMMDEGVRSGTVLFEGTIAATKVFGTANVFDRNCGKGIPYNVSGDVIGDAHKIILTGQAPNQLDGCRPLAFRPDTLVFERQN